MAKKEEVVTAEDLEVRARELGLKLRPGAAQEMVKPDARLRELAQMVRKERLPAIDAWLAKNGG